MSRTRVGAAALVLAGLVVAGEAAAVDIPVATLKFITIDKEVASGTSKTVYVSKDGGAAKTGDNDIGNVAVTFDAEYAGTLGTGTMKFEVPAGASNGTDGWVVNKTEVAKYVNKSAPSGPTGAKVAVIKPGTLLKLIGRTRGDSAVMDLIGADTPSGSLYTAYTVTEPGGTNVHCSEFPLGTCSFKVIGGGSGRKLVCKGGVGDPACTAAEPPPTPAVLELVLGPAGGPCGETRTGGATGTILQTLTCGGLSVGGGCLEDGAACGIAESPTPVGATTRMNAACDPDSCTIAGRTAAQTGSLFDCSDTGCHFGAWLSISNGGTSTCILNTFSAPASGDLDLTTGVFSGSIPLTSHVTLTGNAAEPCPACTGGLCDGSAANPGASCTAINGAGDSYECIPAGTSLSPIAIDLTPITTGTAVFDTTTDVDEVPGGAAGEFCPGQDATEPGSRGCFASGSATVCDYIEARGADAGPIAIGSGPASSRLASVFCIPATGNGVLDGVTDLPGPGAVTLPGTLELF